VPRHGATVGLDGLGALPREDQQLGAEGVVARDGGLQPEGPIDVAEGALEKLLRWGVGGESQHLEAGGREVEMGEASPWVALHRFLEDGHGVFETTEAAVADAEVGQSSGVLGAFQAQCLEFRHRPLWLLPQEVRGAAQGGGEMGLEGADGVGPGIAVGCSLRPLAQVEVRTRLVAAAEALIGPAEQQVGMAILGMVDEVCFEEPCRDVRMAELLFDTGPDEEGTSALGSHLLRPQGGFPGCCGLTVLESPEGQTPPGGGVVAEGGHLLQMFPGPRFSEAAFDLGEVEERPCLLGSQLQALAIALRCEIEEIVSVVEQAEIPPPRGVRRLVAKVSHLLCDALSQAWVENFIGSRPWWFRRGLAVGL